jgi:hypothetical protein
MRRGADGIVNPGAFQCMINSVVAAKLRAAAADFGDLPVLTLNFDFQKGTHLRNRLDAFMYQARQFRLRRAELAAAGGHPAPPAGS